MSKLFKIANVKFVDVDGNIKYDDCLFDIVKDKLCKSFHHILVVIYFDIDEEAFNKEMYDLRWYVYQSDFALNDDVFVDIKDRDLYNN